MMNGASLVYGEHDQIRGIITHFSMESTPIIADAPRKIDLSHDEYK